MGRIYASRLHATPSGRWLLAADGSILRSLEITPQGELLARHSVAMDFNDSDIAQQGPYVYLGGRQGLRILRLDEGTGAVDVVQEVALPAERRVLSLALAHLPVE
jgi:hypothetical protein